MPRKQDFGDPEIILKLLELKESGVIPPKTIRELVARLGPLMNEAEENADPDKINQVVAMKIELDELQAKWAREEISKQN